MDRWTDRKTDTDGQFDRWTYRQMDIQTDGHTGRWTYVQRDRQTNTPAAMPAGRQAIENLLFQFLISLLSTSFGLFST